MQRSGLWLALKRCAGFCHCWCCSEIKERNKKATDEKKARKAEVLAKQAKGSAPKGSAGRAGGAKGPKIGGGGGKR